MRTVEKNMFCLFLPLHEPQRLDHCERGGVVDVAGGDLDEPVHEVVHKRLQVRRAARVLSK